MRPLSEADARRQLAARVVLLRRGKQWTQQALATRAGLPRSYVADVEGARRNPSLHTLLRLANALGVPLHQLFTPEAAASGKS